MLTSRRAFLRGGVTLFGVTAWSRPGRAQSPGAAARAVQRGGEVVQAQAFTYPTFDIHLSSYSLPAGYHMIFDYLLRYEMTDAKSETFELRPGLAESWEQPDPRTVVFHLRRGVKFHDGSAFDAPVAKWNLERLRDHPKSFSKSYLADVAAIEAPDAATLRVRLKAPSGALPFRVSGGNFGLMGMMSKAAFDKLGEDGIARTPSGTGPMRFKQWVTDDRLVLERNPDYWRNGADGKPLPYLDSFVSRYIPDLTVAVPDLQSGQLMAAENMPANQLRPLRANPRLKLIEWPWAGPTYFQMGMNIYKPPFNDLRVRQAALHGIDREGMAKVLGFGYAKPRYYPYWTPNMAGYDDGIVRYEYNPGKVAQLLREAGHPNGVEIELLVIQREPEVTIGQFAAEMWSKLGIKTTLRAMERLTWINAVRGMNYQAMFSRNTPNHADPVQIASSVVSDGPYNWAGFKDPQIDKLMKDADETVDPRARGGAYRKVLARLQEQAYLGTGYSLPFNYVVSARLEGLAVEFGIPDFSEVFVGK
jgi:peptide/nickel transport system substrate-binding protein